MEADFVGDWEHLDLRGRPRPLVADVVVDTRRPPVLLPGVCPALEAHPHHLRDREHVLHGPHAEGRPEDGRLGEVRDVRGEPRRAALMAGTPPPLPPDRIEGRPPPAGPGPPADTA